MKNQIKNKAKNSENNLDLVDTSESSKSSSKVLQANKQMHKMNILLMQEDSKNQKEEILEDYKKEVLEKTEVVQSDIY